MASKTAWKGRESFVAERWFNTTRNPLSGRNNRNDDGSKRLGDNLYQQALVEVKLRKKNAVIERALETRELAEANDIPYIHLESLLGNKQVWALCVDLPLMDVAVLAVRRHIETEMVTPRKVGEDSE